MPAGLFSWGKTSSWYVGVYDGQNMSYLTGPYYLTPVVAQPEITHHLAGAPDGADVPGLNVQVGNYSAGVVDANVPVAGPPLEIRRTYNSQDLRSNSAFGAGWAQLENFFRGQRIHIAVRDLLYAWYPGQFGYRSGGKNNEGPDFPHRGSGYDVELTTPGEKKAHERRGGKYDNCLFGLYNMPKS